MEISVLMQTRPNLFVDRGGDTVKIEQTRRCLQALGVRVEISFDYQANLSGYDLVHLFNVFYPDQICLFARNAKRQGRPVVLSPVYIPPGAMPHGNPFLRGWMSWFDSFRSLRPAQALYRRLFRGSRDAGERLLMNHSVRWCEKRIAELADVALPMSPSEQRDFTRDFAFPESRCRIAWNGIDTAFAEPPADEEIAPWEEFRGWALSVGRMDPNKNQLNLVRAARLAGIPLLLVGPCSVPRYLSRLRRFEGPEVRILPAQPREKLRGLYEVVDLHALVSHFDLCGAVNLEAAVCGCRLVASDRGGMRDYLGGDAEWCEPGDIESIAKALRRAMDRPRDDTLPGRIADRFSWEQTARDVLAGYGMALDMR